MLLLGTVLGLVLVALASLLLRSYIPGLHAFDWFTYLAVPLLVFTVGLLACVLPVRAVLRQTPLTALRDL
jgi:ABC-type antimicrobial peptide transport system permease subunit